MLRLIVGFVLCCAVGAAGAQRHALDEPRLAHVGDASSINDGVVTALAEDDQGFLWIGTTVGLVRHDGYQLRPYTVGETPGGGRGASRFVRSLLAAPGGVLWVGLEGEGLARLDRHQQHWTLFSPNPAEPGALAHGTVRALALDADGVLWVGTAGGGLHRLAPGSERFDRPGSVAAGTLPDDRVYALRVDRRGTLWIGTWRGLVRKQRGSEHFEPVFSAPAADELAGRPVTMLGEDPSGRIWAGTRDGALAVIDPVDGGGQWIEQSSGPADTDEALAGPGGSASFVVVGPDEVWIGRDRAIDLRDARTGELRQRMRRHLHKPWGLGGRNVVALLRDAAGQVWVGSYGGGLQRHNPSSGLWVRRGEGPEGTAFAQGDVRSLHPMANGDIWAGTPDGAVLVFGPDLALRHHILPQRGGSNTPNGPPRFAGGLVGAITQSADGTVWVGSDSGIHAFGPDRRLRARYAMGNVRTRRLLAAADGSLWAATQDGVHRLAPGASAFVRLLREDGRPLAGNVNALVQHADGTVFVGANAGLFRAAPGQDRLQPVPAAAGADLGSLVVLGLLADRQGRLWVDTNAGLHRWRTPSEAVARFERLASPGEPPGSFGANLLEDAQGRIWTHQNIYDPRDGSVQELGVADGVDIGTGWFRAYTPLPDGRMLFGGSTGILVVEPELVRRWTYQPPVVATDLRIDGRRLPPAQLQPALVIEPGQRSFALEFAALDFSQPERNRYRHRLTGFDSAWTDGTAHFRVASYGNLPPGRYTLEVQGSNRLGQWSPHTLSLPVQVLPAWWQTWWAQGGAALLAAGGVLALVQLRTRLLRRRQAELEGKVRERTHSLEALSRELQLKSAELEASSLTDPLTGLHNRRFLTQHMAADAAMVARRHGEWVRGGTLPLSTVPGEGHDIVFFLIDLDHFKRVNDEHGHAAGDRVLIEACGRLKQAFREADYLVRWGGEEFLVAARDTSRERAAELAERARQAIAERPFLIDEETTVPLTASIGFAAFPLAPTWPAALDWTATVDLADAALYTVKHDGRDGWFGLVSAQAGDVQALARAAAGPLADWRHAGGLQVVGSRPFAIDPPANS